MTAEEHIAIDIESLGTKDQSAVTTVGLARFDINTGNISGKCYVTLDVQAELDAGGKVTADTLKWWSGQDSGVFQESISGSARPAGAIMELNRFMAQSPIEGYWGNGPTIDVTFLSQLAIRHGLEMPWDSIDGEFRKVQCMRTLTRLAKKIGFDYKAIPFVGEPHNALDDAIHQATVISSIWRYVTQSFDARAAKAAPCQS